MTAYLSVTDPEFMARFAILLDSKRETAADIGETVARIITEVRAGGDAALVALTERHDGHTLTPATLRFTEDEIATAVEAVPDAVRDALQLAHDRIRAHHERQKPQDDLYTDGLGVRLGTVWTPVEAVGLYVPGGLASYPSSVLMNAVPARVAGVGRLAMVVPTPGGEVNHAVLAAAHIAGITEIYRVGGAQAVAALTYGTDTIAPVAKIVGPGNAYVAAAKRHVFGTVGIDTIAGPSEVLVVADAGANPAWVAADLLAQAEHGAGAQAILLTTSPALADAVAAEIERQLDTLAAPDTARDGWAEFGAVITVETLDQAAELANRIASEHVELAVDDPDALLARIRNAGAIFLGHHTPEAIGDYVAGANHVLPTARTARFASGLGVLDFMKRISVLGCTPETLAALADAAVTLAHTEGLEAHGRSVSIRLNR